MADETQQRGSGAVASPALLYALGTLTVESSKFLRGRGRYLEVNTGSVTPEHLGPEDALELAVRLAQWAAQEMAHRQLRGVPVLGARHHFPPKP